MTYRRRSRRLHKRSQRFLRGGAGSCVNEYINGSLVDPISMAPIPLNRLMRIPVNHDDPNTDYYCFDQNNLYKWLLLQSNKNPLTGLKFSDKDARYMNANHRNLRDTLTGNLYQMWGYIEHKIRNNLSPVYELI